MSVLSRRRMLASPLLCAALLLVGSVAPSHAGTPMRPETRVALTQLRDSIRGWAAICANGALGLSPNPQCNQGDMLEYSGQSCAVGERVRCEDVRRSQSADGRFWRNPAAAVQGDPLNAFSRDMLMGVFDYLLATRDRGAMERFYAYLGRNGNKMCPKATDNRCRLVPGTWGLFGMVMRSLGIPRPFLIRAAEKTVEADLLLASTTVPPGYQMQLVSHHLMVRRAMGQDTRTMRWAAQHIAKRQPLNPLFRYLADGATEEVAQLTREICPAQRGALAHDVFFQRELARNAEGKIVVLRDWKEPVAPLASDVANGHDCIIVLNSLLSGR